MSQYRRTNGSRDIAKEETGVMTINFLDCNIPRRLRHVRIKHVPVVETGGVGAGAGLG